MENINKKLYPEWNNYLHRRVTKDVAADIAQQLADFKPTSDLTFQSEIPEKEPQISPCSIVVKKVDLPWIENLVVFVSDGCRKYYDITGNVQYETSDENLAAVVGNTKSYWWDDEKKKLFSEQIRV